MKFDDLDARMRVFETAHDRTVPPGVFLVTRLDGRGFTRLTKESLALDRPFDGRFRDAMSATASHLMTIGCRVIYAYHQSDEISLLFSQSDTSFNRKVRKLNSILAGEASARFSIEMGTCAAFDCRVCELPSRGDVVDYFRWRAEDALRNALNAHCYWALRDDGLMPQAAHDHLKPFSTADKRAFLAARGVDFDAVPAWHRRGTGIRWQNETVQGHNPKTGASTIAQRRKLAVNTSLPERDDYTAKLLELVDEASR